MSTTYREEMQMKTTVKLREILSELPPFVSEFMRGISDKTSALTRLAYAYDLRIFFKFLKEESVTFICIPTVELTHEHLAKISIEDIEEYMEYLTYYLKNEEVGDGIVIEKGYQNHEDAKSRKLSSIRSLFSYFYKKRKIPANIAELVDFPKLHKKNIIRLDTDEVAKLLDEVESGANLTKKQKEYHYYTKMRDLAIVTLLLGTGIRISECIGLDINHIDFNNQAIAITRKGGNQSVVYFNDEVQESLLMYLEQRKKKHPKEGHENALFLSMQNRRMEARSIQMLVRKYSNLVTPLKKISPHKLRSTYGTTLYRETGDIYLVADALGHADVNTTKKHYADMDDERRRSAPKYIKLRKE